MNDIHTYVQENFKITDYCIKIMQAQMSPMSFYNNNGNNN